MNRVLSHIGILANSLVGECLKFRDKLYGPDIQPSKARPAVAGKRLIVSLTSYGERTGSALPFTIYSILRQSVAPDEIVVWLDREEWNDGNLPSRISELKDKNLITVRYCENLRSYKKIIPSLEAYPDDLIITVDDDLYYRRNLIADLVSGYREHPDSIIAHRAHCPEIKNGVLQPYSRWKKRIQGPCYGLIFPTSGGGTLYQKRLFHGDICNRDLFMSLCPSADDVWLFFMAQLNGTEHFLVGSKGPEFYPLDNFRQSWRRDSLYGANGHMNMNDSQINAMVKHYDYRFE